MLEQATLEMKALVPTVMLAIGLAGSASPLLAEKLLTTVTLHDAHGQPVGTATLSPDTAGGVSIALDLKNLPAGEHAFTSIRWASAMRRRSNPPARISIPKASSTVSRIRKGRTPAT